MSEEESINQLELFGCEPPEHIEICWNRVDLENDSGDLVGKLDCVTCHKTCSQKFVCKRELELYGVTHLGTDAEWQNLKSEIEQEDRRIENESGAT